MVDYADKYMTPTESPVPGDVVMYRMYHRGPTKHCGIYIGDDKLIHAYSGHAVAESHMITNKGSKLTHVFSYPSITEVNNKWPQ